MPEELQTKLDFYLEAYEQAKQRVTDTHAAATIVQELAKDLRKMQIGHEPTSANGQQPATLKQIEYLRNLGVEVKKDLTKREASALIDEALAREE